MDLLVNSAFLRSGVSYIHLKTRDVMYYIRGNVAVYSLLCSFYVISSLHLNRNFERYTHIIARVNRFLTRAGERISCLRHNIQDH